MKRLLPILLLAVCGAAHASEAGGNLIQPANNSLGDTASLQRGARLFVNYCVSCHSAAFMRYNRVAQDLGLSDELVEDNLILTGAKVGDTMQVAMRAADARNWFGVAPPDLSVIARARGTDWLYSFLISFYKDPAKPTGVNNMVFPNIAMPHVLWELQGVQEAVFEAETDAHGVEHQVFQGFELVAPGSMSEGEYRRAVRDLVNFLEYVGEPAKLKRYTIGTWVMLYLGLLLVVAWLLKREIWRDIH